MNRSLIVNIGLLLSIVGGVMIFVTGIFLILYANPFYMNNYYITIGFSIIAILGISIGSAFRKEAGIYFSLTMGMIGLILLGLMYGNVPEYATELAVRMLALAGVLGFLGPIFMLIGGITGLKGMLTKKSNQ